MTSQTYGPDERVIHVQVSVEVAVGFARAAAAAPSGICSLPFRPLSNMASSSRRYEFQCLSLFIVQSAIMKSVASTRLSFPRVFMLKARS